MPGSPWRCSAVSPYSREDLQALVEPRRCGAAPLLAVLPREGWGLWALAGPWGQQGLAWLLVPMPGQARHGSKVSWALPAHAVPSLCQREVEILMFLSAIVMMKNRRSSESGGCGGWGLLMGPPPRS